MPVLKTLKAHLPQSESVSVLDTIGFHLILSNPLYNQDFMNAVDRDRERLRNHRMLV